MDYQRTLSFIEWNSKCSTVDTDKIEQTQIFRLEMQTIAGDTKYRIYIRITLNPSIMYEIQMTVFCR